MAAVRISSAELFISLCREIIARDRVHPHDVGLVLQQLLPVLVAFPEAFHQVAEAEVVVGVARRAHEVADLEEHQVAEVVQHALGLEGGKVLVADGETLVAAVRRDVVLPAGLELLQRRLAAEGPLAVRAAVQLVLLDAQGLADLEDLAAVVGLHDADLVV